MAKLATRKLSTTIGGVSGKEVKVELEPLGHGQRFRLYAVVAFTLIFLAQKFQPGITEVGLFNKTVLDGEWWRVITYGFLHGNWPHLIMNMLACFVFARVVEMHYGRRGMVVIFLTTTVLAVVPELLLRPEVQMVGASGGLMGLWGAQVAAAIRLRKVPKSFRMLTEKLILTTLVTYFVVQVVLDHVIPNVAYWAHLGGFASGLAIGAVLPLFGAATVLVSSKERVQTKTLTIHDVVGTTDSDRFQSLTLALQPGFDPKRDYVVVVHDRLGMFDRHYTVSELVAGTMPFTGSAEWANRVTLATPTFLEGIGDPQKIIDALDQAAKEAKAKA